MCWRTFTREPYCEKIGFLSCIVLSQRSDKNFAHHLISAKDPWKFASFRIFGGKWACLIMKTLKNREFDTYFPTLLNMFSSSRLYSICKDHTSEEHFLTEVGQRFFFLYALLIFELFKKTLCASHALRYFQTIYSPFAHSWFLIFRYFFSFALSCFHFGNSLSAR